MKIIHLLSLSASLLLSGSLKAQWGWQAARLSMVHQSQSLPGAPAFLPPYRPGVQLGVDGWVRQRRIWQQSAGADLTYYYQPQAEHAVLLNLNYRIGIDIAQWVGIHLLTGAGYKHSILPGKVYREVDGAYQQKTHWGTPQFNFKLGAEITVPVHARLKLSAGYTFLLANHPGLFPFSPHSLVSLGGIYQLKQPKS